MFEISVITIYIYSIVKQQIIILVISRVVDRDVNDAELLMPSRDYWFLMPRRDFHFRNKNEPMPSRDSSQTSPSRAETLVKRADTLVKRSQAEMRLLQT